MKETRSYYAIIPANVRYDQSLSASEKLLFGEISALCNDKGYCWSTNKYFSDLYGVSQSSISRWISVLVSKKYLFVKTVYREGTKEILERRISIVKDPIEGNVDTPVDENVDTPIRKNAHTPIRKNAHTPMRKNAHTPMRKNAYPPIRKNAQENTKETNNTVINKSVSLSNEDKENQELTEEIRECLKKQIEYEFFETNFPDDLPGVNVLIDCMAEMLISPYTKINGIVQQRSVLKTYIGKVNADIVREFLDHMRGKKMQDVKNIRAYWQSAFINFIKEDELVMLTI